MINRRRSICDVANAYFAELAKVQDKIEQKRQGQKIQPTATTTAAAATPTNAIVVVDVVDDSRRLADASLAIVVVAGLCVSADQLARRERSRTRIRLGSRRNDHHISFTIDRFFCATFQQGSSNGAQFGPTNGKSNLQHCRFAFVFQRLGSKH